MLVLMLMSILMSHASVGLFVLSFVLPRAYAYVASENQSLGRQAECFGLMTHKNKGSCKHRKSMTSITNLRIRDLVNYALVKITQYLCIV